MSHAPKETIVAELLEAIARYGADAGPKIVRDKHPEVPRASWFRYLKAARATPLDRAVAVAREATAKLGVGSLLPAPLTPAILAARPVETRRAIDFLGGLIRVEQDIEMLRAYAVRRDADGGESIKNPAMFASAVKLALEVLEKQLGAYRELYSFERMQEFYEAIIDTIRQVDPDVARRIMEELARLDRARGFTFTARPAC